MQSRFRGTRLAPDFSWRGTGIHCPLSGLVVASSALRPALHSFRISGTALAPLQSVQLEFAPSAAAFHPRAGILYVTHNAAGRTKLTLWQAGGSETLHRLEGHDLPAESTASLAVQAHRLWVAGPAGILGLPLDPETGRLRGAKMQSCAAQGVCALLVHTA